jgi:hypothetical protein
MFQVSEKSGQRKPRKETMMKKIVLGALAITAALAATPASAGTHISFGFYSPAPVAYYEPPVVYYPPVQHVYYAPPRPYYVEHRGHGRGYGYRRGHDDRRYSDRGHRWGQPRDYGWR